MKRSIYGFGMLLILLAAGIVSTCYMQQCHEAVKQSLTNAAAHAQVGQWEPAEENLQQAKTLWDEKWGITAALSDHEPMETVNDLLAQLEIFAREQDQTHFCAICAQLQEALNAIGEAHSVAWWNLA